MPERFWAKVDKSGVQKPHMDTRCWAWIAGKDGDGYGQIALPGRPTRTIRASVYSWLLHFGDYDRRLFVLHLCDTRECTRPDHLYLGDAKQNAADCKARGNYRNANHEKTACKRGHEFTPENTYINPTSGARQCKACHGGWG